METIQIDKKITVIKQIIEVASLQATLPLFVAENSGYKLLSSDQIKTLVLEEISLQEDLTSYHDGDLERILQANTIDRCLELYRDFYWVRGADSGGAKWWVMEKAINLAATEEDFKKIFSTDILDYENLSGLAIRKFAELLLTEKVSVDVAI